MCLQPRVYMDEQRFDDYLLNHETFTIKDLLKGAENLLNSLT